MSAGLNARSLKPFFYRGADKYFHLLVTPPLSISVTGVWKAPNLAVYKTQYSVVTASLYFKLPAQYILAYRVKSSTVHYYYQPVGIVAKLYFQARRALLKRLPSL